MEAPPPPRARAGASAGSLISASEGAQLLARLPDIVRNGQLAKAQHAPLGGLPAYRAAMSHVLGYVREHGCVVYGGLAWHALIPGGIYDAEVDFVDVDIYSPRPLEDVKAICDMLHERGVPHVNAKNSVHDETYSVYIGSQKCMDVSYMPMRVYRRLPTVFDQDRGLRLVHPKLVMMDILRMFVMPAASYWRMDRTLPRALRFFEAHGWTVDEQEQEQEEEPHQSSADVVERLEADPLLKQHLMWVAPETFLDGSAVGGPVMTPRVAFATGRKYVECVERVRRLLQEGRDNEDPSSTTYVPFLNYLGRSTRFGDEVWIYDLAGHGYTCMTDDRGRTVGTLFVTLFYLMARNLHAYVWGDAAGVSTTNWYIRELLAARASATARCEDSGGGCCLEGGGVDPRFSEFGARMHGTSECAHHEYFKRNILKTTGSESSIHPYRPGSAGRHGELHPEAHRFRNTTGGLAAGAPNRSGGRRPRGRGRG